MNNTQNPLNTLNVIDRMEIGPVKLERQRLRAPYKIIQNNGTALFDLIYHYQENVFSPEELSSINLANMIAAQVAINYGLFCGEIIFRGIYDEADQKFIMAMMNNTAREIFVKKFLEPNPFLLREAAHLPAVKCESYLKANIVFEDSFPDSYSAERNVGDISPWITDRSFHAVLSSGGKDSLLSFSLLREIGRKVHPIFINESGRHWFTALNGYRFLSANYPETAKVWTNADRLFTWMLRHFPFIRQDFASIRSDEYPIRLWTVAVFIFGALPLLKKREIGRLIIGDEFDTTSKLSYKGITHYDGLFDQSRYFDKALSRYYIHKNWNINQFSVIRPLSELLIEKILVQRYPDLQRQQVSCHATHIDGGRVYPCGQCEKCRRIVGMLMAIGADPSNCGYTKAKVKLCLKVLPEKGVHQEKSGAQHLMFLLKQKGLIQQLFENSIKGVERPEILKIRFDPEKSPIEGIPVDLSEPLYRIFLEHSDGAVKRQGRIWIDYNPLDDSASYGVRRRSEKHEP